MNNPLTNKPQVGMQVVGSDANTIGTVKEVREDDFLVDIPRSRDVYVPLDAVKDVTGNNVALNIPAKQVHSMNWPHPPMMKS